jgi:tetratricopeptide (TPR) repeat protein
VRRQQRAKERADRQRERLRHNMSVESARYAADADIALKQGNVAKAANLYRLALRADPNNAELQEKWESCRAAARRSRATDAFARAQRYLDMGQSTEAAKLFLEAAEAAPTAEHLAYATEAVCIFDASRARDLAMAALDALASEKAGGANFKPKRLGTFHLMIARGFKAAGLTESAKQQAAIASELRPGDVEVRALLKALKVK